MTSALCEWPLATLYSASTSWMRNGVKKELSEHSKGTYRPRLLDHLSSVCRHTRRDGQARKFSNCSPSKTVYRVGTNLDKVSVWRNVMSTGQPTFRASCRPSNTARLEGSVSFLRSAFARLRALIKSSNTVGRRPFRREGFTNQSSTML